ncbi:hypothetical protein LCGC14_1119640 [marine sediment metagenome]|uniref:Uncharacterized protein n=1 Tax=marine sediment metagenome TaxID=412755 RepID=A0A0F9PMH4_9ZZZZ
MGRKNPLNLPNIEKWMNFLDSFFNINFHVRLGHFSVREYKY